VLLGNAAAVLAAPARRDGGVAFDRAAPPGVRREALVAAGVDGHDADAVVAAQEVYDALAASLGTTPS